MNESAVSSNPSDAKPLALIVAVPSTPHLSELTQAAQRSLTDAGYSTEIIDLLALNYQPAMPEADRRAYHSGQAIIDPLVQTHADLVMRAQVIAFVFPSVWGTMPSVLKGWLDRTFVIGVALVLVDGKVERNLTHVNHVIGVAVSQGAESGSGGGRGNGGITGRLNPKRTHQFADHGKRLLTRTIPIITKKQSKHHFWHYADGGSDTEFKDFAAQVATTLRELPAPSSAAGGS